MALVNRIRRQYAVRWRCIGYNREGERVYAEPEEIKCRWEGMTEQNSTLFAVNNGSKEILYLKPNTVRKGDAVWKGKLEDLPPEKTKENPFKYVDDFKLEEPIPSTWEVAGLTEYPWLRNQKKKKLEVASLGPKSRITQGV